MTRTGFYAAGPMRLAELRAAGVDPVGAAGRERAGARLRERQREENAWNAAHPERADPEVFRRDVLPALRGVPLRELSRRTGLSVSYCGLVRRGLEVPHERWWAALRAWATSDMA